MMHKNNFARILLILSVGVWAVSACGPAASTPTPAQVATAT